MRVTRVILALGVAFAGLTAAGDPPKSSEKAPEKHSHEKSSPGAEQSKTVQQNNEASAASKAELNAAAGKNATAANNEEKAHEALKDAAPRSKSSPSPSPTPVGNGEPDSVHAHSTE